MEKSEYISGYDIQLTNYTKRLRVWKQQINNIINEYNRLLTISRQYKEKNEELTAKKYYNVTGKKIISIPRVRNRIYIDFIRLSSSCSQNKYQDFRNIYIKFITEIDKIEDEYKQIYID